MKSKQFRKMQSALLAAMIACTGTVMPQMQASAAAVVTLSPNDTYAINNGVFEGWGTSLCWWANRLGYSDSLAQQAADIFYGENGLRLNIARFNIGGGDDPTHDHITRTDSNMPGYTKYNNGNVTYDWTADANQRNVLKRCVEAAGDDAIVEMFSNSPPYWMCKSGCSTGNQSAGSNNLKDDCYDDFTEYLAEVCKHYQDEWNIKVQSVEAMNEPYTNFWGAFSGKQEGCHFDIGNSESTIILELKKSMERRGMGDVILCGTDETSIDTQIDAFNALSSDAKAAISRIDTHTYGGSKRSQLKDVALNAGKNLWMSEVDGKGEAGTNAGAMAPGLWLSERITADCNGMNASAWILWQVIDSHVCAAGYNGKRDGGMLNMNAGFWGLSVADHDNDTIVLSKKYYCFGQYTRYIRPGMIMLNSANNTMAAYDKKNNQLVIVAYNTSGNASDMTFDLTQFDTVGNAAQTIRTSASEEWKDVGNAAVTNNMLKVSLAPNSVTTYIIDDVTGGAWSGEKITPVALNGTDSWKSDASYSYEKAFDGKTSTYFDGVSSGWVQADLGASYDITGFGYCPRSGYEGRCADAMFQISDNGTEWTTVYTIPGAPSYGMHYVKVPNGPVSARYVRYAVPEGTPNNGYNNDSTYCCNIAEIEIYGYPEGFSALPQIEVNPANVTGSEAWKQSSNDAKKAFDGSTSTFFDGTGAGWVQADLGGLHHLDAIAFCPRKGYEYRCMEGYFEVSKNGTDWEKVYTITGTPAFGMQYITDVDVDARYIRYAVPEGTPQSVSYPDDVYCCNIAEIALYGTAVDEPFETTTTTTETTTTAPLPAGKTGDVNCDASVDVADAVLLARMLSEDREAVVTERGRLNADCNHNGNPDFDDVTMILKAIALLITLD